MNNNENQNQHLVEEEDQDDELEEVSVLLCKIIKTHSNFQILFIFILCHVLYDFDFLYIIYISFANDVVNLVFYANKLRLSKRYILILILNIIINFFFIKQTEIVNKSSFEYV